MKQFLQLVRLGCAAWLLALGACSSLPTPPSAQAGDQAMFVNAVRDSPHECR
jgi:hypothetical protein